MTEIISEAWLKKAMQDLVEAEEELFGREEKRTEACAENQFTLDVLYKLQRKDYPVYFPTHLPELVFLLKEQQETGYLQSKPLSVVDSVLLFCSKKIIQETVKNAAQTEKLADFIEILYDLGDLCAHEPSFKNRWHAWAGLLDHCGEVFK